MGTQPERRKGALLVLFALLFFSSSTLGAAVQGGRKRLSDSQITQPPGDQIYLPIIDNDVAMNTSPSPTLDPSPTVPTLTPSPLPSITSTPTQTLRPSRTPKPTRTPTPTIDPMTLTAMPSWVMVGAGDITNQGSTGDDQTASLILAMPTAVVFTVGDNVHAGGTLQDYLANYDPSWGKFKDRTHPAIGNHDTVAGYAAYFGAAGEPSGKTYYSYDVGAWHVVVLNSNCGEVGGCGKGSSQEKWLKADLAAHPTLCSLAYWHHPYYSSGEWQSDPGMKDLFQDLYTAGAELVMSGHNHDYERYAPQDANGNVDTARGVVQFVVGTGGANHTPMVTPYLTTLQVWNNTVFGVLKLTLSPSSYSWQFVPVKGGKYSDSGTMNCH